MNKEELLKLIPEAPKSKDEEVLPDYSLEVPEIVKGILANMNGGRYCHHMPLPCGTPSYEFPDVLCEEIVLLFREKGWHMSYENMSDMDGSIQFTWGAR